MEPSDSVAMETGANPAATETAEPEDEPAGVCASRGLSVSHEKGAIY